MQRGRNMRAPTGLFYIILFIAIMFFVGCSDNTQTAREEGESAASSVPSSLFFSVEGQDALLSFNETIMRGRVVMIDSDLLYTSLENAESPDTVPVILELNLFDDCIYVAVLNSSGRDVNGVATWVGHIEGIEHSEVTLSVIENVLSGSITLPDGEIYRIQLLSESFHAIYQIDQSAFPED